MKKDLRSDGYDRSGARRHVMRAATAMAVIILSSGSAVAGASEAAVEAADLAAAIHARDLFGLETDPALVSNLLTSGDNVNSDRGDVPLTADEAAEVDLSGRAAFVQDLERQVLPYARAMPNLAGVWIDQRHDGRLVVAVTEQPSVAREALASMMPAGSRGLEVVTAAHSLSSLTSAFDDADRSWAAVTPAIRSLGFAIDERRNTLQVKVREANASEAGSSLQRFADLLGVDAELVVAEQGTDLVCTARNNCYSPLRAGGRIHKDSPGGGYNCAMGFHITLPEPPTVQFLTAGHCGHYGSDEWHHNGTYCDLFGKIGNERASLYSNNGSDIMRVALRNASTQASEYVYGRGTSSLGGPVLPVQGERLCMSMARSDTVECGEVATATDSWYSETGGYMVTGASLDTYNNSTSIGGDSGSPIFREVFLQEHGWALTAVGILDHERYTVCPCYGGHDIYFAKVKSALDTWGAELYTE